MASFHNLHTDNAQRIRINTPLRQIPDGAHSMLLHRKSALISLVLRRSLALRGSSSACMKLRNAYGMIVGRSGGLVVDFPITSADKVRKITVEKLDTGETYDEESDVVISARGSLNQASWPKIDGLDTFSGEVMHSAKWNQEYVGDLSL